MNIADKITINKKKYRKYDLNKSIENVFGGKKKHFQQINPQKNHYEEQAGLNDLDSNILNTKAVFSTSIGYEIRLSITEKKLHKIKKEIKDNKILGIKDSTEDKKLYKTQARLEKEIILYRQQYRELGVTYKIADTLNQASWVVFKGVEKFKNCLKNNPLIKKIIAKNPVYAAKKKLGTANLVNKKLVNELTRPVDPKTQTIEHLLIQSEKLIR